jgi:hypothetical protein
MLCLIGNYHTKRHTEEHSDLDEGYTAMFFTALMLPILEGRYHHEALKRL